MYDCVVFDMDGLVIDSETLAYKIVSEMAEENSLTISFEQYAPMIGRGLDFYETYLRSLFPDYSGEKDLLNEFQDRLYGAIVSGRLELKKGFRELIAFLKDSGIKRVLASSNTQNAVELSLASLGIAECFEACVFGELVEHTKPSPDIFLMASKLAAVPPERCLVLEDSPAGIRAACAAHMDSILIPDIIEPEAEIVAMCSRKCESLLDVIDYIKEAQRS